MRGPFALLGSLVLILAAGCLGPSAPLSQDLQDADGDGRQTAGIPDDPDYVAPFAHGTCEVVVTAVAVDGNGSSASMPCDAAGAAGKDVSAAKAVLVEVEWDELQPTAFTVHVIAKGSRADHESSWATLGGAYGSPLRLVLHTATLEKIGDGLVVDLEVSGAAYDQAFTVHASFFAEDRVDPAYSAVS